MKALLRLLALLILAAPAAGAAIPADAQALIDKHVAWLGGWGTLDAQRDMTLEGTIQVSGLTGILAVRERHDGRLRTEYDLTLVKGVECLDDTGGWERNASGQVEDLGTDKAAQMRRQNDRAFNRHLRGEGVDVSTAGILEKGGRTWSVLRFTYPDGDLCEMLVDPVTGESDWSRTVEDDRETWTLGTDVRVVDGVRLAFKQETYAEHAAENQVVTWTRADFNTGLRDSVFARPGAGTRVARLSEGTTVSAWQSIELHLERWIYLRGSMNGVATDILLDSGAGMTVLDRAFAESAGLRAEGAVAARGTGGVTEAGMVEGVTLQIGDLIIGPLTAAVIDLADVAQRIGRPMPVILGKEVFHAMVVDVDYPGARIRFLDPAKFRYEGPGHRLDLIAGEEGHKSLLLSMEGGEPVVVGLDTGQGNALSVFGHYAQERGFLTRRLLSESKGGGVGGTTISKTATLTSVTLAGFELKDVPVTIHQENVKGAFDTKRQAGNLGAGLLNRFRVLFDYEHDALWLEPGPQFDAPLPRDRAGLNLERENDVLVVRFVAPGSPAATAGWREGEHITALDGEPVGPEWWRVVARWARAADGTTARLTMADGSERTLGLRAYY
jgi:predicted aspartyl protease